MNPAMVLAQCVLGMLPWTSFIPYVIAEFLGALVGALICYVMYKDHFTESEGNVNPIAIRNIFSQIQTAEICQETSLSKHSQQQFSLVQF